MKNIVIVTTNPVKGQAVIEGFSAMFPDEELRIFPVKVQPGISVQPMTDAETLVGASE